MGSPKRWPPQLNDDVTGEILLRIPPDELEHLIRASVVCKLWLRVASDPAFLRRYAAFHRGAPLLGFFYNLSSPQPFPSFVPTTAASLPPQPKGHGCWARWPLDCRHGRVLLRDMGTGNFVVWDPFSNHWDELPAPWDELQAPGFCYWYPSQSRCNAVVLCAVAGCDHSSCRGGPFHVVCVGVHSYGVYTVRAHVYSSESRTWWTPPSEQFDGIKYIDFDTVRAGLIGDGVYFTANQATRIVKYDLVEHRLSTIISVPPYPYRNFILLQNEDGSLGIAGLLGSALCLWSTMVNAEGVTGWLQRRVIKLDEILPAITTSVHANVISFAEDVEVFFISTNVGAFTFDLKSGRVTKVGEPRDYQGVTPLISFITPGRAFAANRQRKHYIAQIKNGSI